MPTGLIAGPHRGAGRCSGKRTREGAAAPASRRGLKWEGTRATKRENSIMLAAPAGDEADSPDQVPASTLLWAKGVPEPQRSKGRAAS
jgi:hypothetical protein